MTLRAVQPRPVDIERARELTNQGRLATITETVGLLATGVRDRGELRGPLLALIVQAQLWLRDIDDDTTPREAA